MNLGTQLRKIAVLLLLLAATVIFPRAWLGGARGAGLPRGREFAAGTADGLLYQSATAIPVNAFSAPQGVYVADFDGNGIMDFAVLNPKGLQVLLGQADGTFLSTFTYNLPNSAQRTGYIQTADFNHDGHLDLAFSVIGAKGEIGILLGNGDGTFQNPIFVQHLKYPNQFTVADFNSDGNLDLVIQLVQGNKVAVLLGNGDGTFGPMMLAQLAGASAPLGYVFTSDFNGDGHPDILVLGAQVCTLFGVGDGTFSPGPCTSNSGATGVGVTGYFDQNGTLDIADIEGSAPYSVDILLGNGDGSFQAPAKYPISFQPAGLQTASLTNNGVTDLLVSSSSGLFSALDGNGDGTFSVSGAQYAQGGTGAQFAVADFTGDGIPDAAFAEAGSSTITLAQGNGDRTFQAAQAFSAGTYSSTFAGIATADFNGDGNQDAATVDATGVTITLGNPNGTFQPSVSGIPSGTTLPGGILAGDFNGDGLADLAILGQGGGANSGIELLFGNGNGTFQAPVTVPAGANPLKFVSGDFNQDGNLDFAVLNNCVGMHCTAGGSITVLLGDGHGNFPSGGSFNVQQTGPQVIIAGNFNGDAYPDLAVLSRNLHNNAFVTVLLNNGDGTFGVTSNIMFGASSGVIVSLIDADMNNDGIQDLVVTAQELLHGDTALFVLPGHGDGTFTAPGIKSRLGFGNTPAVADANGDGFPDLIYPAVNSLRFLLGNGDGSFQLTPISLPSTPPVAIVFSDLNADGNPDLLAVGDSGTGGTLYLEPLLYTPPGGNRRTRR